MVRYWRILVPVLAVSVFAGISLQLSAMLASDPAGAMLRSGAAIRDALLSLGPGGSPDGPAATADDRLDMTEGEIALLREPYLAGIHDPAVQVKAIEHIRKHLESFHPWTTRDRTGEALGIVFPGQTEELAAMEERLCRYGAWMNKERPVLMGMREEERDRILWDRRREIFGRDAEVIWAGEIRSERVFDRLEAIGSGERLTLAGKLAAFTDEIRKTCGRDAGAYMDAHRQELLERFFTLPGVQAELGAMDTVERRESLMAVRRDLGMDDETLARWERLDKVRDERWDRGRAYMAEHRRIADAYRGQQRERMLVGLRERYFGAEAASLAGEEQAGYFRFNAERIHGLN